MTRTRRLHWAALIIAHCIVQSQVRSQDLADSSNIAISLSSLPPCELLGSPSHVEVQGVGGFKDSVGMAEIVSRLKHQAVLRGADAVFDIQFQNKPKELGIAVNALVGRCTRGIQSKESKIPIDKDMQSIITRASSCESYRFKVQSGELTGNRTINSVEEILEKVNAVACDSVRAIVLAPSTYAPLTGMQGSCPFFPQVGYSFKPSDSEAAWVLVSSSCGGSGVATAIAVHENEDWRNAREFSLTKLGEKLLVDELRK